MGKLIDSYNEIISHVKSINDRIRQIESEIQQKSADTASDKTASFKKTANILLGDYDKAFNIEQVDIEKL